MLLQQMATVNRQPKKETTLARRSPAWSEIVTGDPLRVDDLELVPVVRVSRYVRRGVHVGSQRLAGRGEATVHMQPVAVLQRGPAGEHLIPIPDPTARALRTLLLVALALPLALGAVVLLVRRVWWLS